MLESSPRLDYYSGTSAPINAVSRVELPSLGDGFTFLSPPVSIRTPSFNSDSSVLLDYKHRKWNLMRKTLVSPRFSAYCVKSQSNQLWPAVDEQEKEQEHNSEKVINEGMGLNCFSYSICATIAH